VHSLPIGSASRRPLSDLIEHELAAIRRSYLREARLRSIPISNRVLLGRPTYDGVIWSMRGSVKREKPNRSGDRSIDVAIDASSKPDTRRQLLVAAQTCLCQDGYARLSTRRVADLAGVPLSQIHYHFKSKQGLVLAVLAHENERLLKRQAATFSAPLSLSQRWERACDYLDEDLLSGYVRVLQEMIAAGWSDLEIAVAVRRNLQGWYDLLTGLADEAGRRFGGLGPFTAAEVACLAGNAFMGSEALVLLGMDDSTFPTRAALRKFAVLIRQMEGRTAI
jgi:AcrR family transcriptional regulator